MSTETSPDLIPFTLADAKGEPHEYRTILLPARKGIPLSLRLVKALGGPLMALAGGVGDDEGVDLSSLIPAFKDLDPEELTEMAIVLLSNTMRDGKMLVDRTFDKAYAGNYEELYLAVWEVVKVNHMIPLLGTLSEAAANE